MSLEKLLKQIRIIVREEIDYALDKKLNESTKKDDITTLKHGMSLMKELGVKKHTEQSTNSKKSSHVSKTGINSIQDILNETRMSMESAMNDDYPEIRFTSDSISDSRQHQNMVPDGYKESDITPEVASALTRDYSALMAKINEKKGV